jgi:hypothetical protein
MDSSLLGASWKVASRSKEDSQFAWPVRDTREHGGFEAFVARLLFEFTR